MRQDTFLLKNKYLHYFQLIDDERFNLFSDLIWDNSINNYFQILDTNKLTSYLFNINYMYHVMITKFHNYISYRNLIIKKFKLEQQKIFKKELKIVLDHKFCSDIVLYILEFI